MCGRYVGDLNAGPGNFTGLGKSCGWNAAHGGFRRTWAAAVTPFPVMSARTAAHASKRRPERSSASTRRESLRPRFTKYLGGRDWQSYVAGAQLCAAKDLAAWQAGHCCPGWPPWPRNGQRVAPAVGTALSAGPASGRLAPSRLSASAGNGGLAGPVEVEGDAAAQDPMSCQSQKSPWSRNRRIRCSAPEKPDGQEAAGRSR
jgi:hypothetical protein